MINHVTDPMFILLVIMAVCIICAVVTPKIFQECKIPEANNFNAFLQFFKIEECELGAKKFFQVKILKKNMIFFKTWESLKERFSTKEEAEKFLLGRKHVSVRNSLYAIRMVYKLRLLRHFSEMKVV